MSQYNGVIHVEFHLETAGDSTAQWYLDQIVESLEESVDRFGTVGIIQSSVKPCESPEKKSGTEKNLERIIDYSDFEFAGWKAQ
jgi:hypothetical protein